MEGCASCKNRCKGKVISRPTKNSKRNEKGVRRRKWSNHNFGKFNLSIFKLWKRKRFRFALLNSYDFAMDSRVKTENRFCGKPYFWFDCIIFSYYLRIHLYRHFSNLVSKKLPDSKKIPFPRPSFMHQDKLAINNFIWFWK